MRTDRKKTPFAAASAALALAIVFPSVAHSQTTPQDHAAHHGTSAGAGASDMDMKKMMKTMLPAPSKELFPSLIEMPELNPAARAEIERQAHERMEQGLALLEKGLEELSAAQRWNDYAAMDRATARMREGLDHFETGVAAHRAVAQGRPPRELALAWFKKQMSLSEAKAGSAGEHLAPFHFFVMAFLVLFLALMAWVYVFKMRRAAALFRRLAVSASAPAPKAEPGIEAARGPEPTASRPD